MRPTIQCAPPSDSGPWRNVLDRESNCVHVMPLFGPRHAFFPECWCHPVRAPDDALMVIHNVAQ